MVNVNAAPGRMSKRWSSFAKFLGQLRIILPVSDIFSGIRPETQILLCCARAQLESKDRDKLRACLQNPIDWDRLYTRANQQGVMPLLFWHLSQTAPDAVPAHVMEELRREFETNVAHSFYLTAELIKVSRALQEKGIKVAAYKGPVSSVLAYKNLLLRSFCDLDILLHRADLEPTHQVLQGLGYRQQFHSDGEDNEYAHAFVRDEGGSVVVEAHWSITPPHYALPNEPTGALNRLVPVSLNHCEIWTLAPHDQLIVLSWHSYKHRWARLEWIACIAEMARGLHSAASSGDKSFCSQWEEVLSQARELGSLRVLLTGLGLAQTLLDTPLPDCVLRELKSDKAVGKLVRELGHALLGQIDTSVGAKKPSASVRFFRLTSRERVRDKIRYCWRLAMTPRQIDWKPLSRLLKSD